MHLLLLFFVLDHCPLQFRATASLIPSIIFVYGLHYPTLPLSTGEHHPSLNNRSRLNVSVSSLLKNPWGSKYKLIPLPQFCPATVGELCYQDLEGLFHISLLVQPP